MNIFKENQKMLIIKIKTSKNKLIHKILQYN